MIAMQVSGLEILVEPPNGTELSRCDRGGEAAEGAVGCSEMLGGPSNLLLLRHRQR
jgi:hypothetical protein